MHGPSPVVQKGFLGHALASERAPRAGRTATVDCGQRLGSSLLRRQVVVV